MAAQVISVLNPKGGPGKTTLATHLATRLHRMGRKTLLADTDDSTTSARKWVALAIAAAKAEGEAYDGPMPVAVDDPDTLETAIPQLAGDYDFIVIDGAAMAEDMAVSSIIVSDLVLIPTKSSRADADSGIDIAKMVRERAKLSGRPKAAFVLSQIVPGSVIARDTRQALSPWAPVLKTEIPNTVRFQESYSAGMTIFDHSGGGKFAESMDGVIVEALELLVGEGA